MRIYRHSPITRRTVYMDIPVTLEQLDKWKAGMLIQDAMPNLSADQREFIMTGILPHEWERLFGEKK